MLIGIVAWAFVLLNLFLICRNIFMDRRYRKSIKIGDPVLITELDCEWLGTIKFKTELSVFVSWNEKDPPIFCEIWQIHHPRIAFPLNIEHK